MYPTKRLESVTLKEAWSGFEPNLNHLRVFGSVAYEHLPGQLRKKMDDKGEVMILIGYHSTNGYKLFDVAKRKFKISLDVIVDEIKELQQSVTGYIKALTDYNFRIPDFVEMGSA